MGGVLVGFAVIAFLIVVGYVLARIGIVDVESRRLLNDVAFFAASPALLFTVMATADLHQVFSTYLLTILAAVVVAGAAYWVLARAFLTRDPVRLSMGVITSNYSNANNMGLPIAIYVLGSGQYIAPLLLFQVVLYMPTLLFVLDLVTGSKASWKRIVTQPLRAPIVFGSALGLIVALTGWQVPEVIWSPLEILGGAAVPMMLLAFGVSLHGDKPLQAGSGRRETILASAVKTLAFPVIAYVLGNFVFGLEPQLLFAAVVVCALPTAQNVYQFALRYNAATVLARDVILTTTFASFPIVLVIAALLHP